MTDASFDYTVADFNYIEHADGPQKLRLFMPVGTGPFPLVVDVHGGAWCNQDLTDCEPRDLVLVRAGFAVAALNFRHAGSGYPTSLVDINYAIRWLKAHAGQLGLRGGRGRAVGAEQRRAPGDAVGDAAGGPSVCCGGLAEWSRGGCLGEGGGDAVAGDQSAFALSQRSAAEGVGESAAWVGDIPSRHELYWKTEAAMEEGNPMLILGAR